MSAFHRFLFSTFLFLALGCFWSSSAFSQTYTYWKTYPNHPTAPQVCDVSLQSACLSSFGNVKTTNPDCTTSSTECKEEYGGSLILKNTCKMKDQWGTYTGQTYSENEGRSNITYYGKITYDCPVGKTFT